MSEDENIYDVIEIEDLDFDKRMKTFYYPCPCGDRFAITIVFQYNRSKIGSDAKRV